MSSFALELLIKQRDVLIARKIAMLDEINAEIADIESGIKQISGGRAWETKSLTAYDDENPNYIKASGEEL
jgi:hypothetical protein